MKGLLVFLMVASLSGSALAQSPPPLLHRPSRVHRLVRDTLIGAAAGAATGWLLWAATKDCKNGICTPPPQHAIVSTALLGAAAGTWVGVVQGWGVGHPDVRTGRHLSFSIRF
jgi:hypothetical protein